MRPVEANPDAALSRSLTCGRSAFTCTVTETYSARCIVSLDWPVVVSARCHALSKRARRPRHCGRLDAALLRPGCNWLSRRREARPVPQAEPHKAAYDTAAAADFDHRERMVVRSPRDSGRASLLFATQRVQDATWGK